ncbi:septum formation initiator family protein [Candidatus Uhrbacteria bacterium]|nr:septum formation initiator family protein [Candidatus Uhrbacteria bacterium]
MSHAPTGLIRYLKLKRVLILNALLFAFVAWGVSGEYARNRALAIEIDRLERQSGDLRSKNAEIGEIGQRFTRPEMIEREARLKLGLQRPGESVIIVKEPSASAASVATGETKGKLPGGGSSNIRKWLAYFFH